jgi:hypothetical protein
VEESIITARQNEVGVDKNNWQDSTGSAGFNIYCTGEPLPCISGKVKYLKNENPGAAV